MISNTEVYYLCLNITGIGGPSWRLLELKYEKPHFADLYVEIAANANNKAAK